ncbi:hypothetical protein IWX65_003075 [Arthrobacter sp. CAN_A214]
MHTPLLQVINQSQQVTGVARSLLETGGFRPRQHTQL